jgi:AcrR family transcriptional regulator
MLFNGQGLQNVTLQQIANEASISVGNLAYHFHDKEQISNSAGYCYIGEENGQRSCSEIYEGDICMSGDIFPSNELCMYPKLRQ